ncbi:MAG: hypothetical protein Q7T70_19215 [Polaromonas sp.]|nr:hypothetical protein [Polaromonas sp.]
MDPLQLATHFAGFAAPALVLAVLLAVLGPALTPNRPAVLSVWACAAINFVAGLVVLAAGLWWFGRDGKMATYAALVVGVATSQWLAGRAWRR